MSLASALVLVAGVQAMPSRAALDSRMQASAMLSFVDLPCVPSLLGSYCCCQTGAVVLLSAAQPCSRASGCVRAGMGAEAAGGQGAGCGGAAAAACAERDGLGCAACLVLVTRAVKLRRHGCASSPGRALQRVVFSHTIVDLGSALVCLVVLVASNRQELRGATAKARAPLALSQQQQAASPARPAAQQPGSARQ